jgi:hypothetical protein
MLEWQQSSCRRSFERSPRVAVRLGSINIPLLNGVKQKRPSVDAERQLQGKRQFTFPPITIYYLSVRNPAF